MNADSDGRAISVVAVDDHPSYVHGLRTLFDVLSKELRVVGVATTVEQALVLIEETTPDIALLDVRMPGREGVEAAKKIAQLFPSVRIVMLTVSDNPDDVLETLRAGARGYLTKDITPEDLFAALKTVMCGEVVLAPAAASALVAGARSALPLDETEVQILKLLATGAELSEIAAGVLMSESTLRRAIQTIQRKLEVDNRMQALTVAVRRGLI